MTREEIIQAISDDKMMPFIQPEQLAQIVEFVIKNYRPQFPSNIDEVSVPELEMAEWMKYGPHTNYPWCSVPDAIKITAEHFFALGKQAGAEWQAKQGYSLEYIIQYAWGVSDTSTESKKATLSFPLPADIFEGDRVIIQIRKK